MNKVFYYINTLKQAMLKRDHYKASMIKCYSMGASNKDKKYSALLEKIAFAQSLDDLYAIEKIALQKLAKA